jgi:flagellar biosynthesis chaperone FliJ
MKSFSFPLEAVLEARRAQEDEARQQLALALQKHLEALARKQEAVDELNRLLEAMCSTSGGRFTVADRDRAWTLRQAQEKICAELDVAAQKCGKLAAEKRTAALQKRRDRELLERLKTARRGVWQKDADRAEQHQLDEFAMTRRHQAAQQGHALC